MRKTFTYGAFALAGCVALGALSYGLLALGAVGQSAVIGLASGAGAVAGVLLALEYRRNSAQSVRSDRARKYPGRRVASESDDSLPRYRYDERPTTFWSPKTQDLLNHLMSAEYSVLVGPNNCGKTYLLKEMARNRSNVSYLGPARYQNFSVLNSYAPMHNREQQRLQQLMSFWQQQNENVDHSPLSVQQAIAELRDDQRERLSQIVEEVLGRRLDICLTDPGNVMSQRYVSVGGHNLSFTSSGFRLLVTLFTCLLDDRYDTFLIDEPELGISPEAQAVLAGFLSNGARRAHYFAHVKHLIFATHSSVFLDRLQIQNNYEVLKQDDEIIVSRVTDQRRFNSIHFALLGNRFETLYLPSLVVLVEGPSDREFIERILALKYPEHLFTVIDTKGDGQMLAVQSVLKQWLHVPRSAYHDRILAVLDSVHSTKLERLVRLGVPRENIQVWSQNGIEHVYPPSLMDREFGASGELRIDGEGMVYRPGSVPLSKTELASRVCVKLTAETPMHPEFDEFLALVAKRLGIETDPLALRRNA